MYPFSHVRPAYSKLLGNHSIALFLAAALAAGTATAATITVNTTAGGGISVNGNCSLSEAVVASNFNVAIDGCSAGSSGADVIAFDTAIFSGSPFFAATISLQQSLDITDGGITLEPPAGRSLTIQASGANRLFTVSGGDSVFRRVTLNGGNVTGDGGAFLVNAPANDASLQLENAFLNNNTASGQGGAIGGSIGTGFFNLNIFSTAFTSNTANGDLLSGDIGGGAIGLDVSADFGSLNIFIQNATFSFNDAAGQGQDGGAIALTNSATQGAFFGLRIENSVFNDNDASGAGGAIHVAERSSPNDYAVEIENSRFSMNTASRGGAIWAAHGPFTTGSGGLLTLDRNSFIGNDAGLFSGAVSVEFANVIIRNNLFALNTSGTGGSANAGALRIEHDGGSNSIVSDGSVEITANTFFENEGNPNDLLLDMPLIGAGAAGPSRFDANVVKGLTGTGTNCIINNFPNGNYNTTNIGVECLVGPSSITNNGLNIIWQMVAHPVHTHAAIPDRNSPVVDFWPEFNCRETVGGAPLQEDLLGLRRDPISGLPPDGDGDMSADCDAGSVELAQAFELDVALAGSGQGSVTSNPNGIGCPGDCAEIFEDGSMVELFATAAGDSQFAGWSGDCSGSTTCIVTMDQARSVTATFDLTGESLAVSLDGNGSGTVTSTPAGINCPGTCSATFALGTDVSLAASPDAGSEFLNWAGDCAGSTCQVTMDGPRTVIAVFGDGDLLFLDGFE